MSESLSLVLSSGTDDKLESAAIMAAGAAALGKQVTILLQFWALDAFRAAIAHGIALAEHAETQLRARGGWEVVTPAQLGIVTFRRDGLGDAGQTRLSAVTVADGYAAPSTTIAGGRVVALEFVPTDELVRRGWRYTRSRP